MAVVEYQVFNYHQTVSKTGVMSNCVSVIVLLIVLWQ